MELVSGFRDPLIEFSETMAQWYRSFQTTRSVNRQEKAQTKNNENWGYPNPKYPIDHSPYWILHLMDCTAPPPTAYSRLEQAGVDRTELRNSDGACVLMVTDASGLPLGFDLLDRGWSDSQGGGEAAGGDGDGAIRTTQRVVGVLRRCMEAPMSGGTPRRPHTLRINDRNLHKLLGRSKAALSILKVVLSSKALGDWDPTKHDRKGDGVRAEGQEELGAVPFSMRWPPTRHCHVCKKRSFPSQLKSCSHCKAVLYCSDQCSHSDRTRCPQDASHEHWCAKLAYHMRHAEELADLPFTYTTEVTADDFELEHFLSKNQLTSGYWLHWSLLVRSPRYELHPIVEPPKDPYSHWLTGHSEPCGPLRSEGALLLNGPGPHTAPALNKPLGSWRQYCEWRGLCLSSTVTPLLSSSLSVYHIITALVPKHFPELNILKKQSLKLHIIESSREFHTLLMFWELSVLLPHVTFELVFIGEGLPSWSDEEQLVMQKKNGCVTLVNPRLTPDEPVDKRSIRVKCYRRAYYMLQGPKPDLVIGFRPSIPLHESWLSTLPRLQSLRVPAYFCELTELSCECSQQVMSQATGGAVSSAHINPFHCPMRITGGDNMLPWYSNAFIFHLVYKPVANFSQRPAAANADVPPPQAQPGNPSLDVPKMNRKERKQAARHQQLKKRK